MKIFDIIMFNMSSYSEWERGVSNRNYHVLKELSNDEHVGKILAIDYPPMTLKRAVRNYMDNNVRPLKTGSVVRRSWTEVVSKISDRLFIYSNIGFWNNPKRFTERVREQALALGFSDYIVWSFFPPVMDYTRTIGQKLTVFDAVDNWAAHSSYTKFKTRLQQNYVYIKNAADIIFTVAEDLQKLFDNQPNVYWIPNGVDLAHYQSKQILINRDIADIPKPIIGYIGVIQDRVDLELVKFLASKNQNKSFVMVGPVWHEADKKDLSSVPNIYLLGYKSYEEAPAYIQQFDVAIIPHKRSAFITSTNPMKMYEYLACGKPVVATKDSGVDVLKDFVYSADDYEDFNRKLFLALEEDTEERQKKRKAAVEDFSWNKTVKQMLDIVQKKLSY